MKRTVALLMVVLLVAMLFGCAAQPETPSNTSQPSTTPDTTGEPSATPEPTTEPTQPIALRIGTLKGPTGMGMARLMEMDENGELPDFDLSFSLSGAPDDIVGQIVSGNLDIAAVPVNLAPTLYNKTEGGIVMLAVNTLGVLYVLENGDEIHSIADLAGKKLYATGQASTPEYILNYLLEKNGILDQVTVEYKAEHSELATLLAADEVNLGMLPEPNVTSTMLKNQNTRIAIDLTEEWNKVCDTQLVQGCIIMRKELLEDEAVSNALPALLDAYALSADFAVTQPGEAAALIEKYEILPSAAIAEKALPNCNIVCLRNEEMRAASAGMFEVLFAANPKSIGGKLPGDDFYYMSE